MVKRGTCCPIGLHDLINLNNTTCIIMIWNRKRSKILLVHKKINIQYLYISAQLSRISLLPPGSKVVRRHIDCARWFFLLTHLKALHRKQVCVSEVSYMDLFLQTWCKDYSFLGAFAKLRKATISIVMSIRPSICLSVCPSVRVEHLDSHWTGFDEIRCSSFFRKSVEFH
jgi:hypothetical protein